jgi:hypothetical protein
MSDRVVVSDQDKPFILAVSTLGAFIGEVAVATIVAVTHPKADLSILKDAITFTTTLLTMAWTFYLVKKNGNNQSKQ